MRIELSESLGESIMLNLSLTGTANYGGSPLSQMDDWELRYNVISSGQMLPDDFDLTSATACGTTTDGSCQITVASGETIVDIGITIWDDSSTESPESAIISVTVPSASENLVALGNVPSVELTINSDD